MISLIIPTKDRSEFIVRQLSYYRMVPAARYVWRASLWVLRYLNVIRKNENNLADLLSALSPFCDDFTPVYRSITRKEELE